MRWFINFGTMMILCLIGCGVENSIVDIDGRSKFIGEWKGKYAEMDDIVVIENGVNDDELIIHLHSSFQNAPTVVGRLVSKDVVEVDEQVISGAPGEVELNLNGERLEVIQKGMGMTLKGTYHRFDGGSIQEATLNQVEYKVPLPADKPNDVPVYPNGKVTMVFGKDVKTIRMESEDSASEVMKWFEAQSDQLGWEVINSEELNLMAKKTERSLVVSILTRREPELGDPVEFVIQYR